MPRLSSLLLSNFRNIGSASLEPNSHINIIVGANGAGKSSLLESLSVLAHGRSFRTHKYRSLIKGEEQGFTIFGKLATHEMEIPLGIQRSRNGDLKIKLNEKYLTSATELATNLPLLCIHSNSFKLIEGSPKDRRKFFDWLVFHVKHEFAADWKDFQKCIKQRNTLLRRGKIAYQEIEPWDREIARLGVKIDQQRAQCFNSLTQAFDRVCGKESIFENIAGKAISIEYISGWKKHEEEGDYLAQLKAYFPRDLSYGYTSIGPQKADLRIRLGKTPAVEALSRGQQKLLITSLYLAQAMVFREAKKENPVFAIDDLPSELDRENQKRLGEWLSEFDCQVFVTGIDDEFVSYTWPKELAKDKVKVFHVKHGELICA